MSNHNSQPQPLYFQVFMWLVAGGVILSGIYAIGVTVLAMLLDLDPEVDIYTRALIVWAFTMILALAVTGVVAALAERK